MKTLSEIKNNIISFYSSIQSKVTDFTVGSVINDIFYSMSASLEDVYSEIDTVSQQAYISTATGAYLDKLIYGTFQLARSPATRSIGYVVVYGNSPLANPANITLQYATFDYTTGEFISGLQNSTKFLGYNSKGESGIVYSLIQPKTATAIDSTTQSINLGGRNVQFLLLPVASVLTGIQSEVIDGGINSFPSPPPGLTGVLNTNNPGSVFFSSSQPISGAPFYSRYTETTAYSASTGTFSVVNAYNFSSTGFIEIDRDIADNSVTATYTEFSSSNTNYPGTTRQAGLIFEYISVSTSSITLKQPLANSLNIVPTMTVTEAGVVKVLTLDKFTYHGTTYTNAYDNLFDNTVATFITTNISNSFIIQQRADQISDALIFDPDSVLTSTYQLLPAAVITGASDEDTDAEYRDALRTYLASLAKATNTALEAGTLQVPGITFAKTLPANLSPRGSSIILASDDNGTLGQGVKSTIKTYLENDWRAAGINIIVQAPQLTKINTTMTVKLDTGASQVSITQAINAVIDSYLKGKIPGDSIRYSDVLKDITDLTGILNVYNLILSKELTTDTYLLYKANYDEAVLEKAAGTKVLKVTESNTFNSTYVGQIIVPAGSGSAIGGATYVLSNTPTTTSPLDANAVGILYSYTDVNNYEVLLGAADVLYNMYQSFVIDATTVTSDAFFNQLQIYESDLSVASTDFYYLLSYIYSEPLVQNATTTYPIDPTVIPYNQITDYTASAIEIFRANSITLGTTTGLLVGIQYV